MGRVMNTNQNKPLKIEIIKVRNSAQFGLKKTNPWP